MNRYQKRALQIGVGLLILSLIILPYSFKPDESTPRSDTFYIDLIHWFTGHYSKLADIDYLRLLIELVVIILGTLYAIYSYRVIRRRY